MALSYKCKVKIIPFVMRWYEMVTKYHKKHSKEIDLQPKVEADIQTVVLKKTLESISFERSRGVEENDTHEEIDNLVDRIVENKRKQGG